ncbi:MAG: hypothetical protein U9R25_10605 [Chloroflexota bacterium]|nr:hypothetical protein [Chloroflexota bacterium]
MQTHGNASLHDLFGDFVMLRNLAPVDPRLPPFSDAWQSIGLDSPRTPRKLEPEYALVSAWFLRAAQEVKIPGLPIDELLFIGDTALNDGNAFRNLQRAGGWPAWCFIGSEKLNQPPSHVVEADNVFLANRWSALGDWLSWVLEAGACCGKGTAVVVDMDKTAIGARGRNSGVIDAARVEGVQRTVAELLGGAFDETGFKVAYDELNEPPYHPFTADNQDYLAYICLVLGAGLTGLDSLVSDVRAGKMSSFRQFIDWADGQMDRAPAGLQAIHSDIYERVKAGDPTPFKAFRQNEFECTVARFGRLPSRSPVETLLKEQICITQEVREVALWLRERGCLLVTMSDKPDEATLPSPELIAQGYAPLHRLQTAAVGESIAQKLAGL